MRRKRKKDYRLTTVAFNLRLTGIIDFDLCQRDSITIDIDKLVNMTDAELLTYRNIGPVTIGRINETREALKKLLIDIK